MLCLLFKTYILNLCNKLNSNCTFEPRRYEMTRIYLSTGSNQGDRLDSLVKAAQLIDKLVGKVVDYSTVVETEPWGFEAETNFYNQVLMVDTDLSPKDVLIRLLNIEKDLGRIREGTTLYSSRTIDIDILFYGQVQVNDNNLVIPHPRLHLRKFVLQPLVTIAPDFIHPLLHSSVTELLSRLDDNTEVKAVILKDQFKILLESTNLS